MRGYSRPKTINENVVLDSYISVLTTAENDLGRKVIQYVQSKMTNIINGTHQIRNPFNSDKNKNNIAELESEIILGTYYRSGHYTLVVVEVQKGNIHFYNPSGEQHCEMRRIEQRWRKYIVDLQDIFAIKFPQSEWKISTIPHSRQTDSNNCGVYCLMFAESHLKGELNALQSISMSDLNKMRLKIATQLMLYEVFLTGCCPKCGFEVGSDEHIECSSCKRSYHFVPYCIEKELCNLEESAEFTCRMCLLNFWPRRTESKDCKGKPYCMDELRSKKVQNETCNCCFGCSNKRCRCVREGHVCKNLCHSGKQCKNVQSKKLDDLLHDLKNNAEEDNSLCSALCHVFESKLSKSSDDIAYLNFLHSLNSLPSTTFEKVVVSILSKHSLQPAPQDFPLKVLEKYEKLGNCGDGYLSLLPKSLLRDSFIGLKSEKGKHSLFASMSLCVWGMPSRSNYLRFGCICFGISEIKSIADELGELDSKMSSSSKNNAQFIEDLKFEIQSLSHESSEEVCSVQLQCLLLSMYLKRAVHLHKRQEKMQSFGRKFCKEEAGNDIHIVNISSDEFIPMVRLEQIRCRKEECGVKQFGLCKEEIRDGWICCCDCFQWYHDGCLGINASKYTGNTMFCCGCRIPLPLKSHENWYSK